MKEVIQEPYKIFFETLSNKVRWDIIHLLKDKQYKATDIAIELNYEQSLVSYHLKRLERCGFVQVAVHGRERVYVLNVKTIKPLLTLVDKHIRVFCEKVCVTCT